MKSKEKFLLVAVTMALLSASVTVASPIGQGFNKRVAGLAITILDQQPQGAGQQVDFQIDMTTSYVRFDSAFDRSSQRGFIDYQPYPLFSQSEFQTTRSGSGGLGDANLYYHALVTDSAGRSFTGYQRGIAFSPRGPFASSYAGNFVRVETTINSYIEGELPAIDFGDGSTVDTESLTSLADRTTLPLTSPRLGGPVERIVSLWRGSFSHSYADNAGGTIVAASRCCVRGGVITLREGDGRGVPFTYPGTTRTATMPDQLNYTFNFRQERQFTSASITGTGTPTFNRGDNTSGTFTDAFSESGNGDELFPTPDQRVNSVSFGAAADILAIPTASSWGLAALASTLLLFGIAMLRRG